MSEKERSPIEFVDVDQDEFKFREMGRGDTLVTDGVGCCVAVAVHIPGSATFLGHFSALSESHVFPPGSPGRKGLDEFDRMLKLLQTGKDSGFYDPSSTTVYLIGASHSNSADADNSATDRDFDFAHQSMQKVGFPDDKIILRRSAVDKTTRVEVVVDTGEVSIEQTYFSP